LKIAKLAVAVIVVTGIGAAAYVKANVDDWSLQKFPAGSWETPNESVKNVEIQAEDGMRLHGWYVPKASPRGVVLFLHSGVGNVTKVGQAMVRLGEEANVALAAVDYRGYGKSRGEPSAEGLILDARAMRTWLSQTENQPAARIILLGQGLGALVAERLADENGARGLIVTEKTSRLEAFARHLGLVGDLYEGLTAPRPASAPKFDGPRLARSDDPADVAFVKAVSEFVATLE
jgi:pimeloyl-ACP methyl ester carboxylesterase